MDGRVIPRAKLDAFRAALAEASRDRDHFRSAFDSALENFLISNARLAEAEEALSRKYEP